MARNPDTFLFADYSRAPRPVRDAARMEDWILGADSFRRASAPARPEWVPGA